MSNTSALNDNNVTKKCGEIIITTKKNAKNVYSFNCWFCDTIYIQMKKFTLHLEQEHVSQLQQEESKITEHVNKEKPEDQIHFESSGGNIFAEEIKIENSVNEDIKCETVEEHSSIGNVCNKGIVLPPKFQDPLEITDVKLVKNIQPFPQEDSEEFSDNKINYFDSATVAEEIEMHNFSEDEQLGNHSDLSAEVSDSSDSDFNMDEKFLKPLKNIKRTSEHELVLALIEEYHKNPQLWNTSLTEKCNPKQKEDLLQKMTDNLNAKLKMKLNLKLIKKRLNFVRKQYEKEIEKQMNKSEMDNLSEDSNMWYYDKMSFLKTITENKLRHKKKKPYLKVKDLNEQLLCNLIDVYQNFNSLWDVNHLAYTVKDKRHETMQSMLDDIKMKFNLTLDINKLEKHLNYIHKTYAKDKQRRLYCESKQLDFQPSCSYFNKCVFLETHQGPFKCPNCNEIIDTYNEFQIHKSKHDGSIPFKCQECGMGFKKISNYTIHAKRHLRVFKFHCEICGKGYPFNAELDLHMRSHTGAQPYLCSICGEGFRTAISYDNHIRRHEERFKYFCHICKKGFNHMTRLNDHVKAHLNVRDVICPVCGKGFTSRKYLNHHKRIHEGKNYNCNICGKSFAQDAGLRAHKKYHGTPIGISSIQKDQNKYK